FIVIQQAGVILQARRFAKELQAQRELADKAEASRFTDLKTFMELGLRNIEAQGIAANRDFTNRLEQSDQGLQDQLAQATRTVSAYLGEIEDKLDRALTAPRS
ncbi:MAG: LapA family protein, partial [Rubrivivax sp.]|nr:LapA family protein [Rubrivivax sp.]